MKLIFQWSICCLLILYGCETDTELPAETTSPKPTPSYLAFTAANFNTLDLFAEPTANWQIAGEVFVDRSADQKMSSVEGKGVLVNQPTADARGDLYTSFEHGDIELELEVMMPKGSNSGIYLQSRYELQLLDSWGVESPSSGDMGGIYQRWDDTKAEGEKGYEGYPPRVNAAKAPGLWQRLRLIFHAPRFDANGKKIANARFEEVRLNDVLIHENLVLNGPTRGAVSKEEVALAPIRIQGDHGPVAFRNMRYKLYENKQVGLQNLSVKEYESKQFGIPNFENLKLKEVRETDSISYAAAATRDQFCLLYEGELTIPTSGDYLFSANVNKADVLFVIDQDTIFSVRDGANFGKSQLKKIKLAAGTLPFTLIYNKSRRWWARGFKLFVEGPSIQKHPLHAPSSAFTNAIPPPIVIALEEQPVLQRGFLMHDGKKRTHVISVGTPEKINYSYDLASGALLQVWGGEFLDVTDMWHARGQKQLGVPMGAVIDFHGQPNLAALENEDADWPDTLMNAASPKPLSYELDEQGSPIFFYETQGVKVSNQLFPASEERRITRAIKLEGEHEFWLKIDDGKTIKQLKDGSYAVDDYKYFLELGDDLSEQAVLRTSKNKSELLVKLNRDTKSVAYDIIW
ncbi:MAG: DUF1080 domain-containing protein [Bacteroidota bacterium]